MDIEPDHLQRQMNEKIKGVLFDADGVIQKDSVNHRSLMTRVLNSPARAYAAIY